MGGGRRPGYWEGWIGGQDDRPHDGTNTNSHNKECRQDDSKGSTTSCQSRITSTFQEEGFSPKSHVHCVGVGGDGEIIEPGWGERYLKSEFINSRGW